MIRLPAHPLPFPLPSASCIFFSVFLCVAGGATAGGGGVRGARQRESLYKSLNILCSKAIDLFRLILVCSVISSYIPFWHHSQRTKNCLVCREPRLSIERTRYPGLGGGPWNHQGGNHRPHPHRQGQALRQQVNHWLVGYSRIQSSKPGTSFTQQSSLYTVYQPWKLSQKI